MSLKQKFEALCALCKQTWVPWTCLVRLWEIDELRTKQVLKKLSEQDLIVRRRRRIDHKEIDRLIMRDLVLEQSRQFAKEKILHPNGMRACFMDTFHIYRKGHISPVNHHAGLGGMRALSRMMGIFTATSPII